MELTKEMREKINVNHYGLLMSDNPTPYRKWLDEHKAEWEQWLSEGNGNEYVW